MRALYIGTLFLSSFLLLLVQPMLAKALLPLVGGAPAIWVVTMLFFQLLLLGGYAYAAMTSRYLSPQKQVWVHLTIYALSLLVAFPLQLRGVEDLINVTQPEVAVLFALLASVGLTYFTLSAHSSLLQRWYHFRFAEKPYHLFSAGNLGSLLGLFAYPFVMEWSLPLAVQMNLWSYGFLLLGGLLVCVCIPLSQLPQKEKQPAAGALNALSLKEIWGIVFPAFVPSSLMLGVTMYVTTDVASLPLLWIIPLALYLLSFVLVYGRQGKKITAITQKAMPAVIVITALSFGFLQHIVGLLVHFISFFIIALACHGQVMRRRPEPQKLTSYFFWLSVGGALGGLFNTAAPHLFTDVSEYPIVLILAIFALPSMYTHQAMHFISWKKAVPVSLAMGLTLWVIFSAGQSSETAKAVIHESRNFFGVSRVNRFETYTEYQHGTTTHGIQAHDEKYRLNPVSYYAPVKKMLHQMPDAFFRHPFGVLGLGSGTAACYARKHQELDFFEIDQAVIDIAGNPNYFTYLRDCPPKVNMFKGDGRLELAKQPDARYSLLVMDAFTSDAVPLHLLTREALQMYMRKMVEGGGVIAFDLSNRYLDLKPFIAKAALALGWRPFSLIFRPSDKEKKAFIFSSEWLFLLPPDSPYMEAVMLSGAKPYTPAATTPLWTDQYSNILPAIRWRN
jgi:hypothetical protein